jgi:HD-like signal output (HDOD) protein
MIKWFLSLLSGKPEKKGYSHKNINVGYSASLNDSEVSITSVDDSSEMTELVVVEEELAIDYSSAFYDVIFGCSEDKGTGLNQFERHMLKHVENVLNSRQVPTSDIPKLPATVMEIINDLKNSDTSSAHIVNLIKKDPALAGDILRVANSPYYRCSEEPIGSIEKAVLILGYDEINTILTTLIMQPMLEIKPIYFKLFGQQIWEHSQNTATACRLIAKHYAADQFMAYLLGLVHDVGKIIIFQFLVKAYREIDPDLAPKSSSFKRIMTDNSEKLSVMVHQQWKLPKDVIFAMQEQVDKPNEMSDLGKILKMGNLISEVFLLLKMKMIDKEGCQIIFRDNNFTNQMVKDIFAEFKKR